MTGCYTCVTGQVFNVLMDCEVTGPACQSPEAGSLLAQPAEQQRAVKWLLSLPCLQLLMPARVVSLTALNLMHGSALIGVTTLCCHMGLGCIILCVGERVSIGTKLHLS